MICLCACFVFGCLLVCLFACLLDLLSVFVLVCLLVCLFAC